MSEYSYEEIDSLNLSKEQQVKYAKKFSEGSKELENLLLFLWENNIRTIACCKGHQPEETYPGAIPLPYLCLDMKTIDDEVLKQILKNFCCRDEIKIIQVSLNKLTDVNIKRKDLTIRLKDQKQSFRGVFDCFYNAMCRENFEKVQLSEKDEDFINLAIKMKNLDIDDLNTEVFKAEYKFFPNKAKGLSLARNEGVLRVGYIPLDERKYIDDDYSKPIVCSCAYTNYEGKHMILDSDENIKEITKEEVESLGLLEFNKYQELGPRIASKKFEKVIKCDNEKNLS